MEPIVKISNGAIKGLIYNTLGAGRKYYGFLGIRYANPPKRFEAATIANNKWEGIQDATRFGNKSIQKGYVQIEGSEDSLFLNIYTPLLPSPGSKLLKVMAFFHGGAFLFGSSDEYGGKMLLEKDIVLVTINYRLGLFGFLNAGSVEYNLGLKDQNLALKWIQLNIKAFNGDPNCVTIFGESAGSASCHLHVLSPMSKGLFSRAIMQSGTSFCPWAINQYPEEKLKRLAKILKFNWTNNVEDFIDYLRKVDCKVIAAQNLEMKWTTKYPLTFAPSIERNKLGPSVFLPASPIELIKNKKYNQVPMVFGCNTDEGLFVAYPNLSMSSDYYEKNWKQVAPKEFGYQYSDDPDQISNELKKYYMKNEPFSIDVLKGFSNLYSDRYFLRPTKIAVLAHSLAQDDEKCPIYLFLFGFQGQFSLLDNMGKSEDELLGICHFDEIQYLFNTPFFPQLKENSDESKISKKMINFWTNFAERGNPNSKDNEFWPQVQTKDSAKRVVKWFFIGKKDKLIEDPFEDRLAFWDKLNINEVKISKL